MARPGLLRYIGSFLCFPLLVAAVAGSGHSGEDRASSAVQAAAIALVQANYATPQTPVSSVSVSFTAAQSAGDLSVVVVGWNDTTAQIASVTDTMGNAYQLAV